MKDLTVNCLNYYPPPEEFTFIDFNQEVKGILSYINNINDEFKRITLRQEIEKNKPLIDKFDSLKSHLLRRDQKIAVFGIFKSGKSTLINAILGQKILPSRTNRATGVITSIGYDSEEYANIFFESILGAGHEKISVDKINQYILLDTSDVIAKPPENIKKVEIKLPDFFLPQYCYLTDTPGLLDNEYLTKLSYEEIGQSDLVIIPLRADKLLSEKEREAVIIVNNLLNGNVIFVINRMGVICDDDDDDDEEKENQKQEEKLLKLANKTLIACGNTFIGKPNIITTHALSVLKNKTSPRAFIYRQGVNKIKLQLKQLLNSFLTERVILLARIGGINQHLNYAINHCKFRLAELEVRINELEDLAEKDWERRKIVFSQEITNIRLTLDKEKNNLLQELQVKVNTTLSKAKYIINSDTPKWVEIVKEEWDIEQKIYASNVLKKIKISLNNNINIPNNYKYFIFKLNFDKDFGSQVSNVMGGSFMLGMIRGVGNILNNNWREEDFNRVKQELLNQEKILRKDLDNYFMEVEENVKIYERGHMPVLEKSSQLLEHYADVNTYHKIILESKQLLEIMIKITENIQDWNNLFKIIWQPFAKEIINSFSLEYPKKLKLIKTNLDLNNYINDLVQFNLKLWESETTDQGIWMEILMREYPEVAQQFLASLNSLEINLKSAPVFLWSKKEISSIVSSIIIGIIILLWGQDFNNLNFDLITLRQGIISVGFVYTIFSIVQKMKEKRIEEEINNLTKKITSQIDNYYQKLKGIIESIN